MRRALAACALSSLAWALVLATNACEDPVQVGQGLEGAGAAAPAAPAVPTGDAATPGPDADDGLGNYVDDDFVESDSNRDPFRNYALTFKVRALEAPQREIIMATTAIEQMTLIAIISGVDRPRAMLTDPAGVGYVVQRGDFVGRPEVVQSSGAESTPLTLNWRVERIRPGEVVLSREDPTAPGREPLTRILPLHENETGAASP
jgi:type IV pilus assembly protein PilP